MSNDCFQINKTELVVMPASKNLLVSGKVTKVLTLAPNASVTIMTSGSDGIDKSVMLGEDIDAFTVVVLIDGLIYKASSNIALHSGYVEGITLGGGTAGDSVLMRTDGCVDNPLWNWTTNTGNRLYLSTDGLLTETPDFNHEFLQEIGTINTSQQMTIDIQEPTLLKAP